MGDVLLVRRHGPAGELGHAFEQPIEPDRPGIGDQIEQVADQQLGEAERHLRVAHPRLDRQVGDVLGGGAEDRGHARLVEVAAVAQQVRRSFDSEVASPLQRADRVPAVLVHDARRKGRRRPVDRRSQIRVEVAQAQLGELWVADLDGGEPDVAGGDGDGVDGFLAVDRREPDHVDEARHDGVLEPCPRAVDLRDDLV